VAISFDLVPEIRNAYVKMMTELLQEAWTKKKRKLPKLTLGRNCVFLGYTYNHAVLVSPLPYKY